jgi:uncharacterized protein (TIGR02996 family)
MSSHKAFLSEIIANPDDDAPRLVYADWLEDNGDADRAEFIRLQIRLETMPDYDPERFDLEERALDLLAEHRGEWLKGMPAWALKEPLTFRRGFVGEIRIPPGRFLSGGEKLVKSTPLLRLRLEGLNDRSAELAQMDALGGVPELDVEIGKSDVPRLRPFIENFKPDGVRHFGLDGGFMGYGSAKTLVNWPGLKGLTSLTLDQVGCSDSELTTLLRSALDLQRLHLGTGGADGAAVARLPHLRHLRLGNVGETGGLRHLRLLAAARWENLESFRLASSRHLSEDDLRSLTTAGWFKKLDSFEVTYTTFNVAPALAACGGRLRHLYLFEARLGEQGLSQLSRSDLAEGLTSLYAWDDGFGSSLLDLATSTRLRRLHSLQTSSFREVPPVSTACAIIESSKLAALNYLAIDAPLDELEAQRFASLSGLSRFRRLALWGCRLGTGGVRALAGSPYLGNLKRLNLSDRLDEFALAALLEAPWLPSLRELRLRCKGIDDDDLALIAGCPALSHLRVLDLGEQRITKKGATALAESPHLGRLLRLTVSANYVHSREVREPLVARFGGVYVERT